MIKLRSLSLLGVMIFSSLVLAACGPTSIDVHLTTYKMDMSKTTAKAGDIVFHISNDATDMVHEFLIVKTDLAADALPLNSDGDVDEAAVDIVDSAEDMAAGTSQDLKVHLDAGHYVMICNKSGHYAQGMHVDFTVTP